MADYVVEPRVYPAGRLDMDSEGLLLLTSDGALAHRLTSPLHEISKTYLVQVERIPEESALQQLRQGVMVKGKRTRPAKVQLLQHEPTVHPRPVPIRFRKSVPTSWLRIEIQEGMNRQIRHMTALRRAPNLAGDSGGRRTDSVGIACAGRVEMVEKGRIARNVLGQVSVTMVEEGRETLR